MKTCFTCKETLQDGYFGVNGQHADGLQSNCKICKNNKERKAYREKPTYKIAQHRRVAEARQYVFDWYKLQQGCLMCGETDPICLTADHKDGYVKLGTISKMCGHGSIEAIKLELAKCQCLCSNCHLKRTAKQFGWYANMRLLSDEECNLVNDHT